MSLTTTDTVTAEEIGRELYKNNTNYQMIALFMEHPEFRKFYDTYIQDPLSLQTMLLFMKVYESVEKTCKPNLTPYEKLAIVHEIFNRPNLRRKAVEGFMAWKNLDDPYPRRLDDSRNVLDNSSHKCIESNTDSKYLLEQTP